MRIAITGANGFFGRYLTQAAVIAGHQVTALGRRPLPLSGVSHQSWTLGVVPDLAGQDAVIHAAFRHQPGQFRGGEGDDPVGFVLDNLDGSLRLFDAAKAAQVGAVLFMSSRAVFDGYPTGTLLTEDLPPAPTTLYGTVKAEAEDALSTLTAPGFRTATIRATGIYGAPLDGSAHKWTDLFARFRAGTPIEPRIATEVHAADAAAGVMLALDHMWQQSVNEPDRPITARRKDVSHAGASSAPGHPAGGVDPPAHPGGKVSAASTAASAHTLDHADGQDNGGMNGNSPPQDYAPNLPPPEGHLNLHLSDLTLDRHDLLAMYAEVQGLPPHPLPPRGSETALRRLDCTGAMALGWQPSGLSRLRETLSGMTIPQPENG